MKKLNTAAMVISKIIEVTYWVATALTFAIVIVAAIGKTEWLRFLTDDVLGKTKELEITGFSIAFADGAVLTKGAYIIFFVTMFLVSICIAMIFRNVYLIMKTTQGKTKFAKGETPFQPDNIRMVREIGIFSIAISVIEFVMSSVAQLAFGAIVESSTNLAFVFAGIIILCLSQYFDYGMKLQSDVDGLL